MNINTTTGRQQQQQQQPQQPVYVLVSCFSALQHEMLSLAVATSLYLPALHFNSYLSAQVWARTYPRGLLEFPIPVGPCNLPPLIFMHSQICALVQGTRPCLRVRPLQGRVSEAHCYCFSSSTTAIDVASIILRCLNTSQHCLAISNFYHERRLR